MHVAVMHNAHPPAPRSPLRTRSLAVLFGLAGLVLQTAACGEGPDEPDRQNETDDKDGIDNAGEDSATTGNTNTTAPTTLTLTLGDDEAGTDDTDGEDTGVRLCGVPEQEACNKLDLLFVIDNSGTMSEEQLNLSRNFELLASQLTNLTLVDGSKADIDVNIMFTTTDLGHPLCDEFQPKDHPPAQGSPVSTACLDRLDHFTSIDPEDPLVREEACTIACNDANDVPSAPYINFRGDLSSNVPNGDVAAAMGCIGPQGIDGCGFESPLGAMARALNPNADWNLTDKYGNAGFLRDDAILAIVMVSDEADCTVAAPGGHDAFINPLNDEFWANHPDEDDGKGKRAPTSAVCWNAGVDCTDADDDGVYESCVSADKGVLVPLDDYRKILIDYFREQKQREVVMLGILGVPEVTEHNPLPPYEPIAGGVADLVYRDWTESDIVDTGDPALRQYELGIGPGCTGKHGGEFTGQAVPPVRIKELCQSLDIENPDKDDKSKGVRCCIESICDDDFSGAIKCLAGLLETIVPPPE